MEEGLLKLLQTLIFGLGIRTIYQEARILFGLLLIIGLNHSSFFPTSWKFYSILELGLNSFFFLAGGLETSCP